MMNAMRKKSLGLVVMAASALALSACASLGPYGPQTGARGQGYSEQQIENNRFRVTYDGVGAAAPVADRALFRAAQLTVDRGYDWFEVTQRWTDGRPDSAGGITPNLSVGFGSGRYGGYSTTSTGIGLGLNLNGPSATSTTLEIVMGNGPKPDRPNVYDARGLQDAIRNRL